MNRLTQLKPLGLLLSFVFVLLSVEHALAQDFQSFQRLLDKNIRNGKVDYLGIYKDQSDLNQFLVELSKANTSALSHKEQLAIYINAYNGCTIKLIVDNHIVRDDSVQFVESIKDIGSFFTSPWEKRFCNLGGEEYTLDEIEHNIIRERFDDPRVHFALNCASESCPPLAADIYKDSDLEAQLNRQTKLFVNNSGSNYLEENTLYLSKIFDWYKDDFPQGVIPFIKRYANVELKTNLERLNSNPKIKYLPYDWSLNNK